MATYTIDWFMTLDGFGSGPEGYWGKDGPELREQRAQTYGNEEQALVFGANTYRAMLRFSPAPDDPSHSPLNAAHGSITMNRALLLAGLVDRLELMVFPVITGDSGADPLFADLPDIDLELVDSQLYDGRMQQLVYVPTVR
jgi:dihydrofolate reductase